MVWTSDKVAVAFVSRSQLLRNSIVKVKNWSCRQNHSGIDLFTDTAAILDSIVSDIYYGMLRGQTHTNLPPQRPIITIWNNRIQNGRRIGKKVYWCFASDCVDLIFTIKYHSTLLIKTPTTNPSLVRTSLYLQFRKGNKPLKCSRL